MLRPRLNSARRPRATSSRPSAPRSSRPPTSLVLSVLDSADLIKEVAPRQLFTPFFTTKRGGQGIGLMFVREVLNRHGFAYSLGATGRGETRFEIRFTP